MKEFVQHEVYTLMATMVAGVLAGLGGLLRSPEKVTLKLAAGAAVHPLMYHLWPAYRYWAEVGAYVRQARFAGHDPRRYAASIVNKYRLSVDSEKVRADLGRHAQCGAMEER